MVGFGILVLGIVLFFVLILLVSVIKIVKEYERVVIFRFGRVVGVRGFGLFFIILIFEKVVIVDFCMRVFDVLVQEIIMKDNVLVKVNVVVYFCVVDFVKVVIQVVNYIVVMSQIVQIMLRSVIGQVYFDEFLSEREKFNREFQKIIDEVIDLWGIKVIIVEIKDVEFLVGMQRVMVKQVEVECERRVRIILVEVERQVVEKFREVVEIISEYLMVFQFRIFQIISDVVSDKSNVIVFLFLMEMFKFFKSFVEVG